MGGWLILCLFLMTIGSVVSLGLQIAQYQTNAEIVGICFAWTDLSISIMLFALAIYTLMAFCNRKPNAVFLAKTYLCAVFLYNLLGLLFGDYDETVFGSKHHLISSLIWCVIWFVYLSFSGSVEEVIPKGYRKRTAEDYLIIAALIIVPGLFFAIGFVDGIHRIKIKCRRKKSSSKLWHTANTRMDVLSLNVRKSFLATRK